MYPVSPAFTEAAESPARRFRWTGEISAKDGSVYSFSDGDILRGSGYVLRQCCGGAEIEIGTVYAAELGITLLLPVDRYSLYGAEITLTFHLSLPGGGEESVPMGIFEIAEAQRSAGCLRITAYDRMLRFDKALSLTSASGTAYSFLSTACLECGVEPAQTREEIEALPNGSATFGVWPENGMETYRDLLHWLSQALGCFCRIDRQGRLELARYGRTAAAEIGSEHRFSGSYSDFVTRYTAVSFVNAASGRLEYRALETDDGLTMELGANPLMQYGLPSVRRQMLDNILSCAAEIDYVPFDAVTTGNPALDPGDALRLSGGQADGERLSCVTSIRCVVGGRHTLKGAGKNPLLASAKSRAEKNIAGLLSRAGAKETAFFSFVNTQPLHIGSASTEIISIDFLARERASVLFLAEILALVTADDEPRTAEGTLTLGETSSPAGFAYTGKKTPEITVTYRLNDEEILNFHPKEVSAGGNRALTLFFPIPQTEDGSANTFSVSLSLSGGCADIGEAQIRAVLLGQGVAAEAGDWNGRISVTETLERLAVPVNAFSHDEIGASALVTFPDREAPALLDAFPRLEIEQGVFSAVALNERISAEEAVVSASVCTEHEADYAYDRSFVSADGEFRLRTEYVYSPEEQTVNRGLLEKAEPDLSVFASVSGMEVVT